MKSDHYPEDYKGPKAGISDTEEWIAVRDYDAFCYVKDGTWTYSDFDCYLYSMCAKYHKLGEENVHNMFREMYKIIGISPKDK